MFHLKMIVFVIPLDHAVAILPFPTHRPQAFCPYHINLPSETLESHPVP
jgi:hypothetical protein